MILRVSTRRAINFGNLELRLPTGYELLPLEHGVYNQLVTGWLVEVEIHNP